MKPIKTKHELREELNQQVEEYLQHGGTVNEVATGVSGRDINAPFVNIFPAQPGAEPRTPVGELVAAIEARRKPTPPPKHPRKLRPRKKIILDDFGQPLRWEWVEE
jgi:hypothetical protein